MTKQEIEKAIENGESVWYVHDYVHATKIEQIKLSPNITFQKNFFHFNFFNGFHDGCFYLERTFKTKARAEHYLKHANITRTETLPFVAWEEFKDWKMVEFYSIDKKEIILRYDMWTHYIILELGPYDKKWWDSTEQNFYKAYDECVRLFKGE